MLVNSRTINYRPWAAGLVLVTALTLSSCGKKADDSTASVNPGESTAQITPGTTTTTAKDSTKTTSSKSASTGGATLSAEAQKLGVKPTGTNCPSNAPIKGNINKKANKKIYHEAKAAGYDKVKPEICFADVATAKKAGFIAPKAAKTP